MTKYVFVFLLFFACTNNKKGTAQDHILSVLIYNDSLIIYNGILEKETPFKKIKTEEAIIKNILSDNKKKFGEQLTVLLKVGENTFLEHAGNVKQWSEEMGIINVRVAEPDKNDSLFFKFTGYDRSFIDSMPRTMDLNMPKEDDLYETNIKGSLTLILFEDSVVYYHKSLKDAKKASYRGDRSIRNVIQQEKKNVPEKDLVILIKPTTSAGYNNVVDILDEMTFNNIKRFAMVKLTDEEEEALGVKPFSLDPASPGAVEMPQSSVTSQVIDQTGFLIELKKDQSVWYSITTKNLEQKSQKVNEPIRKNIGNLIAKYKEQCIKQDLRYRFLVKGHGDSKFTLFEEVRDALKDNNEFKYNLVTDK